MKRGIDISKWNPIQDYHLIKKSGVEFAILKVNNAGLSPDNRFNEHVAGCNAAQIPILGGYNYCYANSIEKAKVAANGFVEIAKGKLDTMILDLEDQSIRNLDHLIIDIIHTYKNIASAAGMKFIIYTGGSFYNPYIKKYASEISGIPIWWARYLSVANKKITDPVPNAQNLPKDIPLVGWQYSSKGVIPGAHGYIDLNVWYEDIPEVNIKPEITSAYNPYTEPSRNVGIGTTGNDANYVEWYLWRFGKFIDPEGNPDQTQMDGIISMDDVIKIKEVQVLLGLDADGIVGKITRSIWKKIC